jgi:hypothetical protein
MDLDLTLSGKAQGARSAEPGRDLLARLRLRDFA